MTDILPIPKVSGIITVTPELAANWLEHRNLERNRRYSHTVAAGYAATMAAGNWKSSSHQGLAFDWDEFILDGQHRCGAVVILGKPIEMDVRVRCDPDTFDVLDTHNKRTARQMLKHPNANIISPAARFLGAIDGTITTGRIRRGVFATNPSIADTLQVLENWPELRQLAASAQWCRDRGQILASPHLAVLAQAKRTKYAHRIPLWLDALALGEGLNGADSRLLLRNRMASDRRALSLTDMQPATYSLIVKAWNAYATDTAMGALRFTSSEDIPTVVS